MMIPLTVYKTMISSPVGELTLASDGENLIGLWLKGKKYHGDSIFKEMIFKDDLPVFDQTKTWLNRYFAGEQPAVFDLPLAPAGSEFRQLVWKLLCEIPYGQTTTYGALAKQVADRLGKPSMSAQAVGGAVGHNPISIIIPCHRVLGADGSLTGYAGGMDKKILLLELENIDFKRA